VSKPGPYSRAMEARERQLASEWEHRDALAREYQNHPHFYGTTTSTTGSLTFTPGYTTEPSWVVEPPPVRVEKPLEWLDKQVQAVCARGREVTGRPRFS
jgi:hypothetical protein